MSTTIFSLVSAHLCPLGLAISLAVGVPVAVVAQEPAASIVGVWTGDARLFDKKLREQTTPLATTIQFHSNLDLSGSVGNARFSRTAVASSSPDKIEYRILLDGFVKDLPELRKSHLVVIVTLRKDGQLDADFHLKSRFGFDPTMRVGHFDVSRSAKPADDADSKTAAIDSVRTIRPGDSAFDTSRLLDDTVTYSLAIWRGESRTLVGQLTDIIERDSVDGAKFIRRTQTLRRQGTMLVDSTLSNSLTLAPYQHYAQQVSRMFRLNYHHNRVRGSLGPIDAPPVPIDTTLPLPVFDASNWDLLVRALPLEKGFSARFPVYDPDAGVRVYSIRVTGSTQVQGEDTHVVVLTLARGRESVAWISKQSGELLRVQTLLGSAVMLEQERIRNRPAVSPESGRH